MVTRTPGDSSHFHPLCARMQGISAEILTTEATPPPGSDGAQFDCQSDHIQPASKSALDNQSPSLTGASQSEHTTGEPPGPKPPASGNTPPNDLPPFGEKRFAKLSADLRSELQPNPSLLLEKAFDLFQALRGMNPLREEISSTDPWRQKVFKQLRSAEKAHDAHALLHMTMKRYWSYQFAREYMQERKLTDMHNATKRIKRKRRGTSPRQSKRYTRPKHDHALTKMIQDCWGLCPSVKIAKDDRRRNMANYWLDIRLPMLGLVERLGYAAFIAPALLISQTR
ncbi:hypothetical protein FOTG_16038 [Fusarium oxysporum f. sp. vasinfectum 25433]|uniref:Uncharacterized protein n=1 Tax=Fusarium oxysporum f. sp. vasinfectum 25433 TaxID=1089449 RepID=X0M4N6_FUSOX|nr:hypothetical protein FOTG_16038 [Fusarium oxysporum f. sp. vasinfectum 25433]